MEYIVAWELARPALLAGVAGLGNSVSMYVRKTRSPADKHDWNKHLKTVGVAAVLGFAGGALSYYNGWDVGSSIELLVGLLGLPAQFLWDGYNARV